MKNWKKIILVACIVLLLTAVIGLICLTMCDPKNGKDDSQSVESDSSLSGWEDIVPDKDFDTPIIIF